MIKMTNNLKDMKVIAMKLTWDGSMIKIKTILGDASMLKKSILSMNKISTNKFKYKNTKCLMLIDN